MDIICAHIWKPMPLLVKIASSVLTIPHKNAAEERVFSMIKKNKNELRPDLELSKSSDSIMVIKMIKMIKMNSPKELIPCHKMEFPKALLKAVN